MGIKKKVLFSIGVVGAAVAVGTSLINERIIKSVNLPDGFTITAHTGCEGTKDNTLDAITLGFAYGANIVEFDLYFDANKTAVLSHDEPVGGETTLEEAFALISQFKDLRVNVDVKKTDDLTQVVTIAEKYGILDRIFYTGITREFVEAVRNSTPDVSYYLNTGIDAGKGDDDMYISELIEEVKSLGACGINIHYLSCTKKLVEEFHKVGLLVSVWTVNKKFEMPRILALGCDNITTRKPSVLKEFVDSIKSHN